MQDGIVLYPEGQLTDRQIWTAFQGHPNGTFMTVSRKGAQRINTIVVGQLFQGRPLTNIPCACVADCQPIYSHRNMRVIFTENRDKAARVVNGQPATIMSSQNNTIILRLPEGQQVFVYPVTYRGRRAGHTLPFYPSICPNHHQSSGPKHSTSDHLAGLRLGSSRYCLCRSLQSEEEIGHFFAAANLCRSATAGAALKRPPY